MTSIRCPICKAVVSGDGELALTHGLRDHLADAHEIKDLCEMPTMEMPSNVPTSIPPQDRGPEDIEKIGRGAVPPEMTEGENMEESILCPFCSYRVFGHDEDDLSNSLHDHIEDVHDIRPTRTMPRLKF